MSEQQSDFMQGFYRGKAEGVIVEQERILKLLDAEITKWELFRNKALNEPLRARLYILREIRRAIKEGENK